MCCRSTKRATRGNVSTCLRPSPPWKATSRAPPTSSASSAATSIERCAVWELRRTGGKKTNRPCVVRCAWCVVRGAVGNDAACSTHNALRTSQLILQNLIVLEPVELQIPRGRCGEGCGGDEA